MTEPTRNKIKEEILEVLRTSDDRLRTFRRQIENKYVIIFIGNTRNGKSTLVNYITDESSLIAFQDGNLFRIEHRQNDGEIEIAHGTLSHTTIPKIIEIEGNIVIMDAPGFDDNRGAVQEIINALYINQIKHSKGVRFVLVSDINNIINDNINYFLSFIETVHTIMPNFDKLKDAVSIIFTKDSKNYDHKEIVKLLKTKILDVNGLPCKKNLIKHFVERSDLIGLFKMPSSVGVLTSGIEVNVRNAIFKSLPINVNETDIKFGISKSARIILLETYLEFFDVVNYLNETFLGFKTFAYNKFYNLHKNKLLELSLQQLDGGERNVQEIILELQKRIKAQKEQISSAIQIPDSLQQLYLQEINRAAVLIEDIGVEVPKETDPKYNSNTIIEEVRRKLEYITCIEKVVEMNNKTENILALYKQSINVFYKQIEELYKHIHEEIEIRNILIAQIKSAPQMENRLLEANEAYLFASLPNELIKMKIHLEEYLTISDAVRRDIAQRPYLQQSLTQDIYFSSCVNRKIDEKIQIIIKHLDKRNNEDLFKDIPSPLPGVMGTLMFYAGFTYIKTLNHPVQLTVIGSSFLLFAAFSWKSVYMRNLFSRVRRRYQQKRLFTKRTKFDDCCKEFLDSRRFYHYRM